MYVCMYIIHNFFQRNMSFYDILYLSTTSTINFTKHFNFSNLAFKL